jgi:hypothetical protein
MKAGQVPLNKEVRIIPINPVSATSNRILFFRFAIVLLFILPVLSCLPKVKPQHDNANVDNSDLNESPHRSPLLLF